MSSPLARVQHQLRLENIPSQVLDALDEQYLYVNPAWELWQKTQEVAPNLEVKEPVEFIELSTRLSGNSGLYPLTALASVKRVLPELEVVDERVCPQAKYPALNPKFIPRPNQVEFLTQTKGQTLGLVRMPTGAGKTLSMLMKINELQCTTLILVPNEELVIQTANKFQEFGGIVCGKISGGSNCIEQVTIATYQSFLRGDRGLATAFGAVFFDEVHVACGAGFSRVLQMFQARYRLGFSATYNRNDGGFNLLCLLFGGLIHVTDNDEMYRTGAIIAPRVIMHHTNWWPYKEFLALEIGALNKTLASSKKRNALLASIILREAPGFSSVVMSQTVQHCNDLATLLSSLKPVIYHGQLGKNKKEVEQRKTEVLNHIRSKRETLSIATSQSLGLGFDMAQWEKLFLVTPFSSQVKCEQVAGRIMREFTGKTECEIHDFHDPHCHLLVKKTAARLEVYRRLGFDLSHPSIAQTLSTL